MSHELEHLNFFIDDTPALSIAALRTRARRLKRTHGLGLLIVDYLQLLAPPARARQENRVQEVSEITRGLKTLAKELDVPVLALSQLSRAVEQREDKRPQLADLRESGSIEQDADVVMFVYREEYYLMREEPKRRDRRDRSSTSTSATTPGSSAASRRPARPRSSSPSSATARPASCTWPSKASITKFDNLSGRRGASGRPGVLTWTCTEVARRPTDDAATRRAGAILTVDLGAIAANWRGLRDAGRAAGRPVDCAAVLKADAYGTGAAIVGPRLARRRLPAVLRRPHRRRHRAARRRCPSTRSAC